MILIHLRNRNAIPVHFEPCTDLINLSNEMQIFRKFSEPTKTSSRRPAYSPTLYQIKSSRLGTRSKSGELMSSNSVDAIGEDGPFNYEWVIYPMINDYHKVYFMIFAHVSNHILHIDKECETLSQKWF